MTDKFQWGPATPHPLSQMRTELVWEGKYDEYGRRRPRRDLRLDLVFLLHLPRRAARRPDALVATPTHRSARQADKRFCSAENLSTGDIGGPSEAPTSVWK